MWFDLVEFSCTFHQHLKSRSEHNCFSNRRTQTRSINHMVTSTPNTLFPVAKYDQIWSYGHLMSDSWELFVDYRISAVYTHTVDTPPGFPSRIERSCMIPVDKSSKILSTHPIRTQQSSVGACTTRTFIVGNRDQICLFQHSTTRHTNLVRLIWVAGAVFTLCMYHT